MSEPLLLAVDCGTGSTRAILFDLRGQTVASAQCEWSHAQEDGVAGSQVFDTGANWKTVCACIEAALAQAGPESAAAVAAISATSMREGMVLYDAGGTAIWACPNVDGRSGAQAEQLISSGAAATIYEKSGDWVAITSPARFLWLAQERPEVLERARHMTMLGDWVVHGLSGELVTDASLGSSSGMFDIGSRNWSDEIIAVCGVDRSIFPEVVPSGTAVGAVTAEAAAATGLREGTPVVAGGADTQLGLVGAGINEPGRVTIIGGSFWQQTALVGNPAIDPQRRLRTLCHALDDQWMVEGIGFYSGIAMRWFRDAFCQAESQRALTLGRDVYSLLEEEAAPLPPAAGGLFAVFSNTMQADRWVHAAPSFIGFDLDDPRRSGKAACFRAIEESAAYVSRAHVEIIAELLEQPPSDVTLTGGAANGSLWPQIVADVLGCSVTIPTIKESSALGAAVCAGVGVGLFDDLRAAEQLTAVERVVEPDPDRAALYRDLFDRWRTVYDQSLATTETGAVSPMWRAAGT